MPFLSFLNSPSAKPLQLNQQVITLHLANKGYFDDVELKSVKKFQNDLLAWFDLQHEIYVKPFRQVVS